MKTTLLAIATAAAVLTAVPLLAGTAKADPIRLAQADVNVRIGGPGVVSANRAATAAVSWSRPTDGRTAAPSPCGNGVTA